MLNDADIQQMAQQVGFEICACLKPPSLHESEKVFRQWLAAGHHAHMTYLEQDLEIRFHPAKWFPSCETLIVCGQTLPLAYDPSLNNTLPPELCSKDLLKILPLIYRGPDYHPLLRDRLKAMAQRLGLNPEEYAISVDAEPLMERSLAIWAGLGQRARLSPSLWPI